IVRILLKDFRDVKGDRLYGKRTFVIRHGRRWTCAVSAACWLVGSFALSAVRGRSVALVAVYAAEVIVALLLLRALSRATSPRREQALISAIAIIGRGMIVTLLAHYSMQGAGWPPITTATALALLGLIVIGSASSMVRVPAP